MRLCASRASHRVPSFWLFTYAFISLLGFSYGMHNQQSTPSTKPGSFHRARVLQYQHVARLQ